MMDGTTSIIATTAMEFDTTFLPSLLNVGVVLEDVCEPLEAVDV